MRSRVLITGGASGIGAAIAERCKEDGYETVILDKVGKDSVLCDLADVESTKAALEKVLEDGPICRLVNNVGSVFPGSLEEQGLDDLERSFSLNLRSAFQCTKALLPGMKQESFGRIVSISSRAILGKKKRTVYAASKAGLVGMSKVWAAELAQFGITSNVVAPGPIRTTLFEQSNAKGAEETKAIFRSIPMGRMGEPHEVAHSVSHFLDDRAGFVTGQTTFVCGGLTIGA